MTALTGFAGVVVGVVVTAGSARAARRSSERIAAGQRDLSARQLAAQAFARARAGVSSLHPSLVPDVVNVRTISAHTINHIETRTNDLQEAVYELDQVSALLAGSGLGFIAAAVARHLVVLCDGWGVVKSSGGTTLAQTEYLKALNDIRDSRRALLGIDAQSRQDEAAMPLAGLLSELAETVGFSRYRRRI